jgi:glycosidase
MRPSPFPLVYEVNTRCWMRRLSQQSDGPVTLASVPDEVVGQWADLGFTHIWLMGVWSSGPRGRQHALQSPHLREQLSRSCPDWRPADVTGSPYAPSGYRVPSALGGDSGLVQFRRQLQTHGLALLLDFIPNHVGLDHSWLKQHPEYFVHSLQPQPDTFEVSTPQGPRWIAHGKDPNFPAWTDTAQLDFRRLETQRAVARALESIAKRCDGVRCDMAMLLLQQVFASHWQAFPTSQPPAQGEFWYNLIQQTRRHHPDFLFLAEAYWGLEERLLKLGFDFSYDKKLYDYLAASQASRVRAHLSGVSPAFLAGTAHFLENHDEPRIASLLGLPEHRAAALTILGLPGLRLLHNGQLTGARLHQPVQACCPSPDPPDPEIAGLYTGLLRALKRTAVGRGSPHLLVTHPAWPANPSHENLLVVQWQSQKEDFDLVVVNLAPHPAQAYLILTVPDLAERNWRMTDLLGAEEYQRYGDDLAQQGLYLDVAPYAAQLFHFSPLS